MIHIVKSTSHWQGAGHYPVAIAPSAEVAEHVASLLSTCSFCGVGLGNYQTGDCYSAATMRVRPNVPTLPADAGDWSKDDVRAWFDDQQPQDEREY